MGGVQGFGDEGFGFRVQGLGFRVSGLGFRAQGLGIRFRAKAYPHLNRLSDLSGGWLSLEYLISRGSSNPPQEL